MEMIRRKTDYAIQALVDLARQSDRRALVPVSALVNRIDVPRDFVHKIMRKLVRGGMVYGRAGRGGGFCLAKPLEEINLLDVVTVIQGPPSLNRCLGVDGGCRNKPTCPVHIRLNVLQAQLEDFLKKTTLAAIIEIVHTQSQACMGGISNESDT